MELIGWEWGFLYWSWGESGLSSRLLLSTMVLETLSGEIGDGSPMELLYVNGLVRIAEMEELEGIDYRLGCVSFVTGHPFLL